MINVKFDIDKYIGIVRLYNCPDVWDLKKYFYFIILHRKHHLTCQEGRNSTFNDLSIQLSLHLLKCHELCWFRAQSRGTNKKNPKQAGSSVYYWYLHSPQSKWNPLEHFSLSHPECTHKKLAMLLTFLYPSMISVIATKNAVPGMWGQCNVPAATSLVD